MNQKDLKGSEGENREKAGGGMRRETDEKILKRRDTKGM